MPRRLRIQRGRQGAVVVKTEGSDEACIDEAIETCPVASNHWEE